MFSPFYFASPELMEVEICHRQTDRGTDRQILGHHIRVCVDFFYKLNLLPPYSLRSQGIKNFLFFPRWGFTPLGEAKRFQHDLIFRYLAKYLEDNHPEELAAFQTEFLESQ